jgi:hypothetical protein
MLRTELLEPRMMLSTNPLHAPTIAQSMSINGNLPVTGKTAVISVAGADLSTGAATLRYTWSVTTDPAGGNVSFATNGTTAAASTVATFNEAGSYGLKVTIVDTNNLSVTATATATVTQTLTSISLTNASTHTAISTTTPVAISGTSESVVAQGYDQFGNVLATQPTFTWSTTTLPSGAAAPTFSTSGTTTTATFHKAGSYTLKTAAGGTVSLSTSTTVSPVATSIAAGSPTSVTVNGASQQFSDPAVLDQFGNALATQPGYTWSTTTLPSGATAPTFSTSGTITTATFHKAGSYALKATVTGVSTLGFSTTATVNQVATSIAAGALTSVTVNGASQQFSDPTVLDEFGNALVTQPAYTWSTTTLPSGATAPSFSTSGTTTTATFHKAGSYALKATVSSASTLGFSTTATVNQVATSIAAGAPTSVTVNGASQQFSDPTVLDEFGNALVTQPAYTWSTTTLPSGATAPSFSTSGTTTTATFHKAGSYALKATVSSASTLGFSTTATVNQVATSIAAGAPTSVTVNGASQQFSDPTVLDEFGNALAVQPAYTWSVSIFPSGATAPTFSTSGTTTTATFHKAGTYTLKAAVTGSSTLGFSTVATVNQVATNLVIPATTLTVSGSTEQISDPAVLDQFGIAMTTQPAYTWTATTVPGGAAAPTFSTSGTTTTITYHKAGSYVLKAYVTSASNIAFSPTVTVNQVATSLAQGAATTMVVSGTSQQFTDPAVLDQFGNALAQPSYTWSATTLPSGAAAPTFSTSGTSTTIVFGKAGSYALKAYVTGASNLSFNVAATVSQTFSSIAVSPSSTSISTFATQQFAAQGLDQFHNALATQPAFTWSASTGTISTAGLYTAPSSAGTATVTAKSGTLSASAGLTIAGGSNSLGLNDQALASLVESLDADGSISRLDMIQILRSVGGSGTVGATDLADLRTIVGADATKLNMPNYVQVLGSDVVNSNPANLNYQGAALGNLTASSPTAQLTDLVNKWFFGTDLPNTGDSQIVYEPTAGTLYDKGTNTPVIADEFQGELGDCYFISSLGTIAKSNPSAIENMFINNGDGTYTVRFYTGTYGGTANSDGSSSDGFQNGVGTADYVTVNTMLPTYYGVLIFADYGASYTNANNDLWIPLAEKAYAQWNETGKEGRDGTNTYNGIQGGWMATVDAQVLGYNATDYNVTSSTQQNMIAALAANKAVTIGTIGSPNSNDTLPYGLYGSHAYAVTAYNASTNTFTLYNPWGCDQPGQLTWADIMATTDVFTTASTSGSVPISSGVSKAPLAAVVSQAVSTPAASSTAVSGTTLSQSEYVASTETDASAPSFTAAGGNSSSATDDATRALFHRLGTESKPSAATPQVPADGQTADRLAALSVDEVFGSTGYILESDFA